MWAILGQLGRGEARPRGDGERFNIGAGRQGALCEILICFIDDSRGQIAVSRGQYGTPGLGGGAAAYLHISQFIGSA